MKKFETIEEQRAYLKDLAAKLEEMKKVDPRTVDRSTLVDISTVKVRTDGTRIERILDYIEQVKNPYCYISNGTVVKVSFADTDRTLDDAVLDLLIDEYYGANATTVKLMLEKQKKEEARKKQAQELAEKQNEK